MTPLQIEVLLELNRLGTRYDWPVSMAHSEALKYLQSEKRVLHARTPGRYVLSPKGQAHLAQLCALPLPIQGWTGADGKVIECT